MVESRFQTAFGKRKTLVKARGKPLPNWERVWEERKRQAKARRVSDVMKEIVFKTTPNAKIFSIYGNAIIRGKVEKFSFDVAYNPEEYPPAVIYDKIKAIYDKAYKGELPANYYYQFFLSPDHLLRGRFIKHEGIVDVGQNYITKDGINRAKSGKWTPRGREMSKERKMAEARAAAAVVARRRIREASR